MSLHVDVVKNEPLAGVQQRIAVIVADHGEVHVEPEEWSDRIERLAGPMNGHSPADYLSHVAERLADSTYIFATEPHREADCTFADDDIVPADVARLPDLAGA